MKKLTTDNYAIGNHAAAVMIAGDPVRYPGALQEWAQRILNRKQERKQPAMGPGWHRGGRIVAGRVEGGRNLGAGVEPRHDLRVADRKQL